MSRTVAARRIGETETQPAASLAQQALTLLRGDGGADSREGRRGDSAADSAEPADASSATLSAADMELVLASLVTVVEALLRHTRCPAPPRWQPRTIPGWLT